MCPILYHDHRLLHGELPGIRGNMSIMAAIMHLRGDECREELNTMPRPEDAAGNAPRPELDFVRLMSAGVGGRGD